MMSWESKHIGILGGGQLGRMLAEDAVRMGMTVSVLDGNEKCAAAAFAHRHVVGSFSDEDKIAELAQGCDVVTVEIEHVNVDALDKLMEKGIPVQPHPRTIRLIQNKYEQKRCFREYGLPIAPFLDAHTHDDVKTAIAEFSLPVMLKSKLHAYDGRGNVVVHDIAAIESAMEKLKRGDEPNVYVEKWVPFVGELAVMVARGLDGTVSSFPLVQSVHRNSICHVVHVPAQNVTEKIAADAIAVAEKAVSCLEGAGVFGVELFLMNDGTILLNEVAPRPHNSGHYTIEACYTSQFEQHVRAVLGLPLGNPQLKVGVACMVNVLGAADGTLSSTLKPVHTALSISGASVHWYNKGECRPERKMGHITVCASTVKELMDRASPLLTQQQMPPVIARVGIIMGSDSDLEVMKPAAETLRYFGVPFELTIVSAHRTPQRMMEYASNAHIQGIRVIIAGAGGAAHLPGMVAAICPLPVIGVPVKVGALNGEDSLLSIVQMPRGVPVATVAINNATNAGLLAVRMLGIHDRSLNSKMVEYQKMMEEGVMKKVDRLQKEGWETYQKE